MIAFKRSISRAISHEDSVAFNHKVFKHVVDRKQTDVINPSEHTSTGAGKQMDEDEIEFGNVSFFVIFLTKLFIPILLCPNKFNQVCIYEHCYNYLSN